MTVIPGDGASTARTPLSWHNTFITRAIQITEALSHSFGDRAEVRLT